MTGIDLTGATAVGPTSLAGPYLLIQAQGTGAVAISTGGTAPVTIGRIQTDSGNVTIHAGGDLNFGEMVDTHSIVSLSDADVTLISDHGQVLGKADGGGWDVVTAGTVSIGAYGGILGVGGGAFQVSGGYGGYGGVVLFNNTTNGIVHIWSDDETTVAGVNGSSEYVRLDVINNALSIGYGGYGGITAGGDVETLHANAIKH